jgi:hypothetical protein
MVALRRMPERNLLVSSVTRIRSGLFAVFLDEKFYGDYRAVDGSLAAGGELLLAE